MKRLILSLIFLLFVCQVVHAYSVNWYRIDENNFYDEDSVVALEDFYGYSFLLKAYNKGQYEPVDGRKILYTLSHYEIDCANKTYKIGIMDSYDREDEFVNGDYNKYSKFQPLVEGSAVDFVFKKLCKLR